MKPWLRRAARVTALRTEEPRNRFARWTARWFAPTPTVQGSRFQDAGEPFPDHWRESPTPWPALDVAQRETRAALLAAIEDLPEPWRAVILARDALGHDAANVGQRLELAPEQERAVLNRARAAVRHQIAEALRRGSER